ncbi:MAG: TlpA family protein disulfide reductase [Opitutaceae bacterium]|nr:TlpA family protein disulfide reductase [Opitutaceae bacterium]
MKLRIILVTWLVIGGSALFAQEARPVLDPVATAIWSEHARGMGNRTDGRSGVDFELVTSKAFEFFEKFPEERRVGGILFNLASFGGWVAEDPQSATLRPEWQKHLRRAIADVLKEKTWPDNVWAGLQWVGAKNEIAIQIDNTGHADLDALRQRINLIAARVPASAYRTFLEQDYVHWLEQLEPGSVEAHLKRLAASDSDDLAKYGRGQLEVFQLRSTPMELAFTATDGTRVNLADYRGKVVLLDLWATWCVPCIKELPYVKAALAKWGDKGFAVIGISFDRPGDRAKLEKYIADEKLNWPHWFYEGPGKNPLGLKYNIRSIPATFLLGRDGRLVTTETHGDKLEAALQQLFK